MAKRQVEWQSGEDRALTAVSNALAYAVNSDDPNATDNKLREDVRVFAEFLRLLMAMDEAQKTREQEC